MHPGDDTDAQVTGGSRHQSGANLIVGFHNRLPNQSDICAQALGELVGYKLRLLGNLAKGLISVEVLASSYKPNLKLLL